MDNWPTGLQGRRTTTRRGRLPILLALLLFTLPALLVGCAEDPERAKARGWNDGYEAGQRDGEREGYDQGFKRAFDQSFNRQAENAPALSTGRRTPLLTIVYLLVFLLLGFFAQYSALYLLRRGHLLRDVDHILLGSENASLTLKSLNPEQVMNPLLGDGPDDGFEPPQEDSGHDRG